MWTLSLFEKQYILIKLQQINKERKILTFECYEEYIFYGFPFLFSYAIKINGG